MSGKAGLASGSQQDIEEFLTTVLIELEKEVSDDDGLFSPILKKFWGEEKITRKYLATPDGKCLKCLIYPAVSNQDFLTLHHRSECSLFISLYEKLFISSCFKS